MTYFARISLPVCRLDDDDDDDDSPFLAPLKRLERLFLWEVRVLYLLVAVPVYFLNKTAMYVIGVLSIIFVIILDTYFSLSITKMFIQPLSRVLDDGGGAANPSQGYKSMLQSKWSTLAGTILAVGSSTVLYVMMVFQLAWGGSGMWKNKWLNVFVVWISVNSILNTIGMMFVSGSWKRILRKTKPHAVLPGPVQLQHHGASSGAATYPPNDPNMVAIVLQRMPTPSLMLFLFTHTHLVVDDRGSMARAVAEVQVNQMSRRYYHRHHPFHH